MRKITLLAAAAAVAIGGAATMAATGAAARDQIRIVGSSTVYPFSTLAAERFGKLGKFKTPIVESTGSGGGLKLFCAGVGTSHPDITNASRRIKKSEFQRCQKNGVKGITEFKVGYDGIVVANAKGATKFALTRRDLFLALAKVVPAGNKDGGKLVPNPNKTWKDVNAKLPAIKIEVLGPPPTSGTRDAFAELAMEGGCKTFKSISALKKSDKKKYKALCHGVREDGAWIDAGENDTLIVNKLVANKNAMGVFGFSFLDQNKDKVQGSTIGGVAPTFDNIASQKYPVSRSLWFYVKKAHIGKIPGIKEYVQEFVSKKAVGPDGYAIEKGLIPLPAAEFNKYRKAARTFPSLSM